MLTLLDAYGWTVGEITLWLASPNAALPVGDRAQLDPAPAAEISDADWPL